MSKKKNFMNSIINIQTPFLFITLMLVSVPFSYLIGYGVMTFGCENITALGNTGVCLNNDPYNQYYFLLELLFFTLPIWLLFGYVWYCITKYINQIAKKPFKKISEKKGGVVLNPGFLGVLVVVLIPISMNLAYCIDKKTMFLGVIGRFFPITPLDFIGMMPIWFLLTYICLLVIKLILEGQKK